VWRGAARYDRVRYGRVRFGKEIFKMKFNGNIIKMGKRKFIEVPKSVRDFFKLGERVKIQKVVKDENI
jgi:hypothetical protein|tara:strand:- start:524 stop:727 length:204 start_codon:yes stop_codon:yes gene_type:complete